MLVIVDPIFRGSRLFYSWIISSQARKNGRKVAIITRTNAITDHAREYFSSNFPELIEVVELPKEFWYGKINYKGAKEIVKAIHRILRTQGTADLFFSGINELYPAIYLALLRYRFFSKLAKCKITFVDYEPVWIGQSTSVHACKLFKLKNRTKIRVLYNVLYRKALYLGLKVTGYRIRLGLLDEYIYASINKDYWQSRFGITFLCLPDPSPPIRMPVSADQNLSFNQSKTCILLVGLQSSRKGLRDILDLLDVYRDSLESIQFILSGKLAADMEIERERIEGYSQYIIWYDDYVSDEEIHHRYLQSDYVLLPYKKSFTQSSGVLATSSTLGVPVIGTDHGLVGRRIIDHQLGFVYQSGNIRELYDLLKSIPDRYSRGYQVFKKHCFSYSETRNINNFSSVILDT